MNGLLLKTSFTLAFAAVSFSMAPAVFASPPEPMDQVAASFDRLLNPAPTKPAAAPQAANTFPADPLMAGVNGVLWQKSSYHLPAQYAFFTKKRKEQQ